MAKRDNGSHRTKLANIRLVLWGMVIVASTASALYAVFYQTPPHGTQPSRFGGPFTLQRAEGGLFTEADLIGKPAMMFFGYTFCPDICPVTLYNAASWKNELGLTADDINVIFVSVDPERDTPAALNSYLSAFGDGIIGLTGTLEQVEHAKQVFHIVGEKVETDDISDYLVNHTATLFLLDAQGALFGTIGFDEASEGAVAKIRRLVAS